MSIESFQGLMAELGPLLDEVQQIEQRGDSEWCIAIDDINQMYVHASDTTQKATFVSEVMEVGDCEKEGIFELLLLANNAWQESHGLRFALSGLDGSVMMHFDVVTEGLHVSTLAGIVRNLFEKTGHWRRVLEAIAFQAAENEIAEPSAASTIRV